MAAALAAPVVRTIAPARTLAPAGRIGRLQVLRALAATRVVIFHAVSDYLPAGSAMLDFGLYELLSGGVEIFFVISGFIIRATSWNAHGPAHAAGFLLKRFVRLVPYYWLITSGLVLLCLAAPGLFHSYHFEWRHALASMLFIPWPRPDGAIYPPLAPGWSLNYEVLFYLAFAALMLFARRERAVWWLGGLAVAGVCAGVLADADPALFIAGNPFVLEFVAGAIFADVWRARSGRFGPACGWVALVAGSALVASFLVFPVPGIVYLKNAGFACLVVAFMTLPAPAAPRWLESGLACLGEASYSIYLIHPIVLGPLSRVLFGAPFLRENSLLLVVAITAGALGAGLLAWRFVETPLLALCRARLGRV